MEYRMSYVNPSTVTVSGSVTANAGTNLNTSALALEGGGNLAAINTNTTGLLKPASTLTKVGTVDTITNAVTQADGAGIKIWDTATSTYKGFQWNAEAPQVCAQTYLQALAEGDISGHTSMTKLGVNNDIDNTEEDIWEVGGSYVFPTGAAGLEVVSSSAEDDIDKGAGVPGTGIHKIKIYYLKNDFTEATEEVTLNGTTVVATTNLDYYRINYVEATVVGTGGAAAGNIDVRNLADTPIYARISTGYTKSRQCIYTVPKSKSLYVYEVNFGAICSGTNGARFYTRANYSNLAAAATTFFLPYSEAGVQNGSFSLDLKVPTKFPAGTDLKISAIGTSASANIIATAAIRGWLE